jgi:hypothetical protein
MILASIQIFITVLLFIKIENNRRKDLEREQIFQKWMFDALYSINNKVVLPNAHEIKEDDNLKASVYSPDEDPMSEFEGTRDDWHQ